MSRKDNVRKLIAEHNRHLQKLKEQAARWGLNVPTHILTEIEDRENEIERLQIELADLPYEIDQNDEQIRHNLPQPDYENFIGRKAELKQIRKLLLPYPESRHFVITIDGIGGIGKSTLALEIADSYRRHSNKLPEKERFETIVWTTAKRTVLTGEGIVTRAQSLRTLDDIYITIANTLGREDIINARSYERDDLVRQALTQQRTLLIIDNLETIDDERVLSFINDLPDPTKVIVTTRHRLDVAYPVRLTGLPEQDALRLIDDECKLKRVTLSDDQARRLFTRTGGVPLAIVWSIAQMGFGYGVESTLNRLGQPTNDITKFCFEAALQSIRVNPPYRLLLALSLFVTDASREALGVIAGLPILDRDDGLVELEKLSLVNRAGARFSLLPLTKGFAISLLKDSPEVENSFRLAYIQYFIEFCRKYGGSKWQLYPNLDDDIQNIQLALESAYKLEMWSEVGDFIDNLAEFLDRRGLWNELIDYAQMAVEVGRQTNNKELIASHKIYGLGWVKAIRFRDFDAGLISIQEGKQLALELKNDRLYAGAIRNEGTIYHRLGRHDEAKELLEKSLRIWQKLEDHRWEIRTLGSIGSNERNRGNIDEALYYHTKAFEKAEQAGDTEQMALNLRRFGDIALLKEDFEQSRSNFRQALEIYESLNSVSSVGNTCLRLARTEYALRRVDEAKSYIDRAHKIFSKTGAQHKLDQLADLTQAIEQSPSDPLSYLKKLGVGGYDEKMA